MKSLPAVVFAAVVCLTATACKELVSPLGISAGGIVYGKVDPDNAPVSIRATLVFYGDPPPGSTPGTVPLGARPAFVMGIGVPAEVRGGHYEVMDPNVADWELGCGAPWDPTFVVRDTVFLEPYAVVRRDIRC